MRHIIVPEAQTMVIGGKYVQYGLAELNAEFVWPKPIWRDRPANLELFAECASKFAHKKPGEVVALTDEAYEIYMPLVTMRGETIQNPGVVVELATLMRAVTRATTEAPPLPS